MTTISKLIVAGIFFSMMFVFALAVPGVAQAQYNCTYHSQERCTGNNLYWYDSCGNQQDLAQYCQNGCYNGACQNNYNNNNYNSNNYNNNYSNNYGSCTYHAYKLCTGNNVYWYDSCGTQQDLIMNCSSGQTCNDLNNPGLYGQCTTPIQTYVAPINSYVALARTACYGNSIEWFDSLGVASGLYKNCQDANSCTLDACAADKCSNTLKCDGSTCATGSADYNTYCATSQPSPVVPADQTHCGNGLCETTLGETNASCPSDCKITSTTALSVSFFSKLDSSSSQWQKSAQVPSNSQVYFMISVANNSSAQVDNVNISSNIPSEISSLGDLKLNGVLVSGDIVSGINIGSIAPSATKLITFEGKTQTISASATKQATATSNVSGATQSDSISINLTPTVVAAAVSAAPVTGGFWGFLKKWYLWILGALVLVFLFIVVFKRFSSDV